MQSSSSGTCRFVVGYLLKNTNNNRTYANTIVLPPRSPQPLQGTPMPPNLGGSKSSSPQIWGARGGDCVSPEQITNNK